MEGCTCRLEGCRIKGYRVDGCRMEGCGMEWGRVKRYRGRVLVGRV